MRCIAFIFCCLSPFIIGCGNNAHKLNQQTLSILNIEADKWDGGASFSTNALDSYGSNITSAVEKDAVNYTLELRSNGPDKLPKNNDDIIVSRIKRHGESTYTKEASKSIKAGFEAATGGTIDAIKKGLKPNSSKSSPD